MEFLDQIPARVALNFWIDCGFFQHIWNTDAFSENEFLDKSAEYPEMADPRRNLKLSPTAKNGRIRVAVLNLYVNKLRILRYCTITHYQSSDTAGGENSQ